MNKVVASSFITVSAALAITGVVLIWHAVAGQQLPLLVPAGLVAFGAAAAAWIGITDLRSSGRRRLDHPPHRTPLPEEAA